MTKITWPQLSRIYEGTYGVTAEEAAAIISEAIFSKNWKHGSKKGTVGRMWEDQFVVEIFGRVLEEEDRLVKKFGRTATAAKELFKSDALDRFIISAKLKKYSSYKTFKNDYGKWKQLKVFKNVWKKGIRTSKKIDKRLRARAYKDDEILKASNKMMASGKSHTKKLLESGEYEKIKDSHGNISLRKIPK